MRVQKKKNDLITLKERINPKSTYYLYVISTSNNSIISLTDNSGNVLISKSCGVYSWYGKEKSTEVAAKDLGYNVSVLLKSLPICNLIIFFKGFGMWHSVLTEDIIEDDNLNIISLKDITSVPFNGCRKWKSNLKNKKRKRKNKKK